MHEFVYLAPTTLEEAMTLLKEHQDKSAHVLAAGTDLLVKMKQDKVRPETVIDIHGVSGLDQIEVIPGPGIRIGALVTIHEIECSTALYEKYPVFREAVSHFGGFTIRNMATIGGNLCRGNPSADLPPLLLALNAQLRLRGYKKGMRTVPVREFFIGPGRTILEPDELLLAVELPEPIAGSECVYIKQSPRSIDLATLNMAVFLKMEGERVNEVRIAVGGCGPVPFRAARAEELLTGAVLTSETIDAAVHAVADQAQPRSDSFRCSPEHRRRLLLVLTKRLLRAARQEGGAA